MNGFVLKVSFYLHTFKTYFLLLVLYVPRRGVVLGIHGKCAFLVLPIDLLNYPEKSITIE